MSKEEFVPGIGKIIFTKRRTSRHVRLRVAHDGTPNISMPLWLSYKAALDFAVSKKDWILQQQSNRTIKEPAHGQRIGKTHRLTFEPVESERIRTRIVGNEAIIYYPINSNKDDPKLKLATEKLITRVLKQQSENLLPQRLAQLATMNDFTYSKVKISKMRSRWGSCSNEKLITLNCFLIQLPWDLIDYVLVHELVHTKVLSHSDKFWNKFIEIMPDAKDRRKRMKSYHPHVFSGA